MAGVIQNGLYGNFEKFLGGYIEWSVCEGGHGGQKNLLILDEVDAGDAGDGVEGVMAWRRVVECVGYYSDFGGLASATDCTSAKYKAPIGLFSKRHFSASCFSNVAS